MGSLNTWNTWDVRCLNAVMKVPELMEVRIGIYDTYEKYYLDEMLWDNVSRFGSHDIEGTYFDIDLKYKAFVFNMQFASEGDMFVYKIVPNAAMANIRFFISGLVRWNSKASLENKNNKIIFKNNEKNFDINVIGNLDKDTKINVSHQGVLTYCDESIYIACNNTMSLEAMDEFLLEKKVCYEKEGISGGGMLEDAPQAIVKGVIWNTIYEPIKDRFCTPVSRQWCRRNGSSFGSYVLFDWDTFFCSLLSSIQSKDLAYQEIHSILQEITSDGFVPNFGSERCDSEDRSQPPVGSYCVLKLYRQFEEVQLLKESFPKLLGWNKWWMSHRDGNGDGLLEWGSDPNINVSEFGHESNNMQAAKYESGLDNSPMYDDVIYNEVNHTMELADVGLNSLYALDCLALSEIASELEDMEAYTYLLAEYNRIKNIINCELWNEDLGIYCNKHWSGTFSTVLSPTNFYPLIAGIASKAQAERMINEHLLNENEFWGEYVIPSVAKNVDSFKDNNYWRGRIWGPMNFLVLEGIKKYDFYDTAYSFAKKSLNLFMKEWKEENHIHENYNAITGDGDDVNNADPVYTWGALLAYNYLSELIEIRPWDGLRIGNLSDDEAKVFNYLVGNDKYSVVKNRGLIVEINGEAFIKTTVPVIITGLKKRGKNLHLKLVSRERGTLNLQNLSTVDIVRGTLNEQNFELITHGANTLLLDF